MIYTVTLNPALDKTVEIPDFAVDRVNRISSVRLDPGGKGINVSKAIHKLGGASTACGILAGNTGREVLSALGNLGIESFFFFEEGETRTNLKIIDPLKHTNTDINEPGIAVSKETLDALLQELCRRVRPHDIVVLSGSLPTGAPEDIYAVWIRMLKEKGVKLFLDADGIRLEHGIMESPHLIKPNHFELSAFLRQRLSTVRECAAAAAEIAMQYGISHVVVSMGPEGLLSVSNGECLYAKGLRVPVRSTVGAGDSVVAALAFAEESGMNTVEAVRLAAAAGSASVMCGGSQAAEYEMVAGLMRRVKVDLLDSRRFNF